MKISKTKFGELDGEDIYLFSLDNEKGLSCEILNYGGIIRKLVYNGVDVVLGYEAWEGYENDGVFFGALVGRNASRLENARFSLNGKEYKVSQNNGNHSLHGGFSGFNKKIWKAEEKNNSLVLSLRSPDGDEGYPGNLDVSVTYSLTEENELVLSYFATTDKDTVFNMTNHSYFNLNGHGKGTVENHILKVEAEYYTPITEALVVTGEIKPLRDTPFDFTKETVICEKIIEMKEKTGRDRGFDHNFVINGEGFRKAATVRGDKTNITMEVYTDRPGIQVYTVLFAKERPFCKCDAKYVGFAGVCFETQEFPNSINCPDFPSPVLKKGEELKTKTIYKFI